LMQLMKSSLNVVTGPQQTPRWRRPRRQRGTRENLLSTCRQVALPVSVSVGKTTCRFAGFRYSDLRSPAALERLSSSPKIQTHRRLSRCFVGVLKKKKVRGETTFSERPPKLDFRWPFSTPIYPTVHGMAKPRLHAAGAGLWRTSQQQRAAGSGQRAAGSGRGRGVPPKNGTRRGLAGSTGAGTTGGLWLECRPCSRSGLSCLLICSLQLERHILGAVPSLRAHGAPTAPP
jgi:hypothetical protein